MAECENSYQHSELRYAVRSLSQTYCTWKFCRWAVGRGSASAKW